MRSADRRGDSITSGQMNTYFSRTSVFTIVMRPAGRDENGAEYTWEPIGEQFAVQGFKPCRPVQLPPDHPRANPRIRVRSLFPRTVLTSATFSPDEE